MAIQIGDRLVEHAEELTINGRKDIRLVLVGGGMTNFPIKILDKDGEEVDNPEYTQVTKNGIAIRPERPTDFHDYWDGSEWKLNIEAKAEADLRNEIEALESQITQDRLVEAALGMDDGWLASLYATIKQKRSELPS